MKQIFIILMITLELVASVIKTPLVSVDEGSQIAKIKIAKINVGMSGFIVHRIAKGHNVILKNIEVTHFNPNTQIATLKMSSYDALRNNSLPNGRWSVEKGDIAILAFGYTRGILIAPNEEIYHRITKSVKNLQWVHPDIFATILSFNGHPTPLREDFNKLSIASSVGLVFIYIEKKLYTIDAKSFKILNISDANLKQKSVQLPFYTRVNKIEAAWWGDGSDELQAYAPHYYNLLMRANNGNRELRRIVSKHNSRIPN